MRGLMGKKSANLVLSSFLGTILSLTTASIVNPYDV